VSRRGLIGTGAASGDSHPDLEAVLHACESGVALLDHTGRITVWNEWLARFSGVACDRARGRTLVDVFPDLEGSHVLEAVERALTQGQATLLSPRLHRHPLPLRFDPSSPSSAPPSFTAPPRGSA